MITFFFILGAIIASFVGVVSARIYTGVSIFSGRSKCDHCGRELSSVSLVPIVSYIFSRGKAYCCGARLAFISPLSELVLGTLFAISYVKSGISIELLFVLTTISILLGLVLYDLSHQILPTILLVLFVAFSAITGYIHAKSLDEFTQVVITAGLIAIFFVAIHYLTGGRAMGFADAPLAFGLSLFAGFTAVSGFLFSFWIGAVIGIIILAGRPVGSRMGVEVPFAPFLATGFLLAYFTEWNIFTIVSKLFGL